jgi:hypothetical protein
MRVTCSPVWHHKLFNAGPVKLLKKLLLSLWDLRWLIFRLMCHVSCASRKSAGPESVNDLRSDLERKMFSLVSDLFRFSLWLII